MYVQTIVKLSVQWPNPSRHTYVSIVLSGNRMHENNYTFLQNKSQLFRSILALKRCLELANMRD